MTARCTLENIIYTTSITATHVHYTQATHDDDMRLGALSYPNNKIRDEEVTQNLSRKNIKKDKGGWMEKREA